MKLSWRNVGILLRSDLRMSLRSKAIIFILGMPLILSLVMGLITRQAPVSTAKIAILGETGGSFARYLKQVKIGEVNAFQVFRADEEEAMEALEKGKLEGVITLAEGTSSALKAGVPVEIEVAVDESSGSKAMMIQNLVREFGRAFAGIPDTVRLTVRGIRGMTAAQAMMPMWIVMVLLSGVSLLPATFAVERQNKTLDALLVSPVSFMDVIIGRAAYGVVLGIIGSLIMLIANNAFIGNQIMVWFFILAGSMMSVLLGLFIGLWRKDVQSASMTASLIYVLLLWGVFFAELPGIISKIAKVTPGYHVATGIRNALFTSVGWSEQMLSLAVPLGVALLALIGCVIALRRQEA